jgi:hypothetical protein
MPTYKIGSVKTAAGALSSSRRPLTCERCQAEVAEVWSVAEYSGVSADTITGRWPELREVVASHEAVCRQPREE